MRDAPRFKLGDTVRVAESALQRLPQARDDYAGKAFTVVEILLPGGEQSIFERPSYYIRAHGLTDSLFHEDELEPV
jgi:hypothetical protein